MAFLKRFFQVNETISSYLAHFHLRSDFHSFTVKYEFIEFITEAVK